MVTAPNSGLLVGVIVNDAVAGKLESWSVIHSFQPYEL